TGNIDAVVLRSSEQGCNGNVQTLGGLQPRRLPAFLQNIPVVAYPRSFVDVVESSRIPFLEELQLFQRGIVISEIRLSEEKASGSIRAADLVQQGHGADGAEYAPWLMPRSLSRRPGGVVSGNSVILAARNRNLWKQKKQSERSLIGCPTIAAWMMFSITATLSNR